MKQYIKWLFPVLGTIIFLASCQCKTCTKEGENDVRVCRDNYETEDDYNQALGWYQLSEYSCN
jgi:hypothetical protein